MPGMSLGIDHLESDDSGPGIIEVYDNRTPFPFVHDNQ